MSRKAGTGFPIRTCELSHGLAYDGRNGHAANRAGHGAGLSLDHLLVSVCNFAALCHVARCEGRGARCFGANAVRLPGRSLGKTRRLLTETRFGAIGKGIP